ncbi:hypothetical protein [Nocardiopsis sp. RV163]|uniref:hypothetical protein n=1 Tax=Nocardiopsis sp. RV163 TaxID=1661388 RepID=UPI00064B9BC6|nr:hypothetical protein [Nocardiopsis sp. RV163]
MSAPAVGGPGTDRIRRVLDAPRGQRFVRPGTASDTGPSGCPDSLKRSGNTGETDETTREQRLLAEMADNPRVAYRRLHGELPVWMHVQAARLAAHGSREPRGAQDSRSTPGTRGTEAPEGPRKSSPSPKRPQAPAVPPPRPATDDGPLQPRPPRPQHPERPPLPRRRSQRPHSHRRPRRLRWTRTGPARLLAAYTLATSAGALAQHLATVLL